MSARGDPASPSTSSPRSVPSRRARSAATWSAALAIDRTETELYRRVAALGGIPYAIDMKLDVEGRGFTASLMRKAVTAARVVTTTSVETTPIADELFAIPAGWTTKNK